MDARTVNFDNLNSKNDLNITFTAVQIGEAKPKESKISVPYRDGDLDFSDAFTYVRYNNRTLSFEFHIPILADHIAIYSNVQNKINGKRMKIVLSADQNYYYSGRISVGGLENSNGRWVFEVKANCEPYKYKAAETVVNTTASSSGHTIQLNNERKVVIPEFIFTAQTRIDFGSIVKNISAGTYKFTDIQLQPGQNSIKFTGTGDVTVKYREGSL